MAAASVKMACQVPEGPRAEKESRATPGKKVT